MNLSTLSTIGIKLLSQHAIRAAGYGIRHKILHCFLCLLLQLPLHGVAQSTIDLSRQQLAWLGQQIYRNECNNNPACLTAWNEGENFPSLGIGHFIWYQAGQQEIYTESFPALLEYMQTTGVVLPDWIVAAGFEQPWPNREEFLAALEDPRMQELRSLLATHMDLQTAFIVSRFDLALARLLAAVPAADQQALVSRFNAVTQAQPPYGLYALIDYVHFKGEGTNSAERYQDQGWGLLQVLQNMPLDASAPLEEFVQSARNILAQRITNAPPERAEQRWLAGWNNRLSTYLPAPEKTAVQDRSTGAEREF